MRFLAFVIAASGLHVMIPVGARIAPKWDTLMYARSTGFAQRLEIDIEPTVEIPVLPDELLRPDQRREVATNDVVRHRTNVDPSAPVPTTEATSELPPDEIPPVPTGSSTPPDEYGALPPPSGPGVGLPGFGRNPIWAIPGVVPEATAPRPAPTTVGAPRPVDRKIAGKVISEVMREKDRGLGLDLPGAGAIATIVSDVVRGSTTPDVARATLEVRLAPGGRVASVRVVRSSAGTMGDWSAVAGTVNGRLSGRQFTMPSAYAAGAIVTVEVISQLQYPDGSTRGGPAINKGGGNAIGGSVSFDASNIGARPKRHVRAYASARPIT